MKQLAQPRCSAAFLTAFMPTLALGASPPIVDVRIDAPYRQVLPSDGDEWAPTWGQENVLYTANNDGGNFGGVRSNAIVFGKLEGDDPYQLSGKTISGMPEYHEEHPGPTGAYWKAVESVEVGDAHYRFASCGGVQGTCLLRSIDRGRTWSVVGGNDATPLFLNESFSSPKFISLSKHLGARIGADSLNYVYAVAYTETRDGVDQYRIGRVLNSRLTNGNAADWMFATADYTWQPSAEDAAAGWTNNRTVGPDGANWKTMNAYSVDGALYMFVTRCTLPWDSNDPKHRHIFQHSSIIKSVDSGRSWMRSVKENLDRPMFPGQRFGAPYFIWYGKDGAAAVDNADKYIYAVSNNGHFENGDDFIIGRVPRSKLPDLAAADWTFYKSGDGTKDKAWTAKLDEAVPILRNPGRAGMSGVTYIENLGRYVMVSWHYQQENFWAGIQNKDLSTVLEFFEAPQPWGPWTKFKALNTGPLGWFVPIVGQRFQVPVNATTTTAFLYAPGLTIRSDGVIDTELYRFNYMPITLSTKPLLHSDPPFVGAPASATSPE